MIIEYYDKLRGNNEPPRCLVQGFEEYLSNGSVHSEVYDALDKYIDSTRYCTMTKYTYKNKMKNYLDKIQKHCGDDIW